MSFRCACGGPTRVIDSRVSDEGQRVRRRRECQTCGMRVSTEELHYDLVAEMRRGTSAMERAAEMLHDSLSRSDLSSG